MTIQELSDEMKNRISLALKDPILQQGFEIICKENADLKADNDARKFAMAMSEKVEEQWQKEKCELIETIQARDKAIQDLEQKNDNLKSTYRKQRNKRIDELQKENAELKEKNKWYSEQVCNKECAEVWGNLTKAKEIIKGLLSFAEMDNREYEEIYKKAEKFLKGE